MSTSNKPADDVKKEGWLVKLKTKKQKYFVLRDEVSKKNPARLEYFQDEKKFRSSPNKPRRVVLLKDCLDITDGTADNGKAAKVVGIGPSVGAAALKNLICLYTKKDVFKLGCQSEVERNDWLSLLLELKKKSEDKTLTESDFEHRWEVKVVKKSSGNCRKIKPGKYNFCLKASSISLIGLAATNDQFEFSLDSIRRCGDTQNLFFIDLGTRSSLGEGQLWLEVEDPIIAGNIHLHVNSCMSNIGPACTNNMAQIRPRCHTLSQPLQSSQPKNMLKPPVRVPPGEKIPDQTASSVPSDTSPIVETFISEDYMCMEAIHGRTASSSSTSSLRSSGSSQPSSVNRSSQSSIHGLPPSFSSKSSPPRRSHNHVVLSEHGENPYLDADSITRTSSVGNKTEYLKNQFDQFAHTTKDDEKCSSAPHLQKEGKEGDSSDPATSENACSKPPLSRVEGCPYCELALSNLENYSNLKFKPKGQGQQQQAKKIKPLSFMMKQRNSQGVAMGKKSRASPLFHQHLQQHQVLVPDEFDGKIFRGRLPTIDGSTRCRDKTSEVTLRPRASTGEQGKIATYKSDMIDNSAGYLWMQGRDSNFQSKRDRGESSRVKSVGRNSGREDYLDMTQGSKIEVLGPPPPDYVDMTLGRVVGSQEERIPSGINVTVTSGVESGRSASESEASARSPLVYDSSYLEMSYSNNSTGEGSIAGALSSSSPSPPSSLQNNPSISNLDVVLIAVTSSAVVTTTAPDSSYMPMSFSAVERKSGLSL